MSKHLDALDKLFGEMDDLMSDHQTPMKGHSGGFVPRVDPTQEVRHMEVRPFQWSPEAREFLGLDETEE